MDEANNMLEKLGHKPKYIFSKDRYNFINEKYSLKSDSLKKAWYVISYNKGSYPVVYDPININEKDFKKNSDINPEDSEKINVKKSFIGEYDSGLEISFDEKTKNIVGNLNYEAEVTDCKLTFTGQIGEMKENVLPIKIEGFNYIGTGKMFFKENSIIIKFDEETPSYCQRVLPFENNEIEFYKE